MSPPDKDEAPDSAATERAQNKQQTVQHSEARAAVEQADKAVSTARAKLALAGGYQLHVIDAGHGRPAFLVSRWNASRELADLDAVHAFIRQVGGDA